MEKIPYFPMLEAEISKRGIKKKDMAEQMGITPKSMSNKLTGKTELHLTEILIIQSLIPDVPIQKLFSHNVNV